MNTETKPNLKIFCLQENIYFKIYFVLLKILYVRSKGVFKKKFFEIRSKFTEEHPGRSVISIKLLCNYIEILLLHGCSPINLQRIFRTPLDGCFMRRLLQQDLRELRTSSMEAFCGKTAVKIVTNLLKNTCYFLVKLQL